jgi:hypothetical protein
VRGWDASPLALLSHESLVEGLPRSTLHEFSRTLSFVPAGHRFCSWHKPRILTRVTYFYIDPRGPLIDPELRFAESALRPRLFSFDKDLWETVYKLKAQALSSNPGERHYAEALSITSCCAPTRAQRPLGGIVGHAQPPVIEEAGERWPPLEAVIDRLGGIALR